MVRSTKWFQCWYLGNDFPFVCFNSIQVGLVVKLKGENQKKIFPMNSPIICNCLSLQEHGCVQDLFARVMQFTGKMVW